MGCCNCCCPEGEECCKAPGPDGICCTSEKCCGTSESPECCGEFEQCCYETCCAETVECCGDPGECCLEGQYCCDGVCQDDPCDPPECEADEDCPCVGPEDPYFCPDEDDCCGPLGLVAAGTYGGDAVCCPEGWTFDESGSACLPPDGQSDCYCCDGECQAEPCPP